MQVDANKIIHHLLSVEGANKNLKDFKRRKPVDIAKFLSHGEFYLISLLNFLVLLSSLVAFLS
jgi:hypothetical protein